MSGDTAVREALTGGGRLEALKRTRLLDTPPEEAFDRLTRLVCRLLGAPVALVSLVEADRQFFKSVVGLPQPWALLRETSLLHSFCQHVVATAAPLLVQDARGHPLVADNLAVPDLGVLAYLGMPLATADGRVLGSLCAIDTQPRDWTAEEVAFAASLCDHPAGTLLALHRTVEDGEVRERFRTLQARDANAPGADRLHAHTRPFLVVEDDGPEEAVDLLGLMETKR